MFPLNFETIFNKVKQLRMTVLPDFYIDIIIDPRMSYDQLIKEIQTVYSRGGGNLLGPEAQFIAGGNAGNVAKTLGGLGVPTTFLCETSLLGKQLVEFFLHPLGVKTLVTTSGELASSIILEIPHGSNKHNVMFCASGSVANFSSEKLTPEQWQSLNESHVIAIANAQNFQMENLVETILKEVPPSIVVSVDFSDLTPHIQRIEGFKLRILEHPTRPPTFITGNEIEFQLLAKKPNLSPEEAIHHLSITYPKILFGLHMANKAEIWKDGKQLAIKPCFKIPVLKATGAGDSWHAGFLTGWQSGLSIPETTVFA
ncbi:MAG: carbohydrate kinase family protein, partial [Candidatus Hodarchaeota archaeon]